MSVRNLDALVQTESWCVQSDFVANGEEAQKVGHVPLPVDKIGLGSFFDVAFDRTLVGRRQAFREGEPSSVASAPVFHFEDNDRVRGLTVSASLGLIATAEFNMGSTTWAAFRNVEFNHGGSQLQGDRKLRLTVRAQTNGVDGCGTTPGLSAAEVASGDASRDAQTSSDAQTCPVVLWNATDLSCKDGIPGTCGRLKALSHVPTVAACCAACKATAGCKYFTSSIGDQRCYLNSKWAGTQPIAVGVFSGSLTSHFPPPPPPPPPPAPPPTTEPLKLVFSLDAPSPLGGAEAAVLGSVVLQHGTVVPSGGAESGLYGPTRSGHWCDFTTELALPASVADGAVHDLYVSMAAANSTTQRFTLDYFRMSAS